MATGAYGSKQELSFKGFTSFCIKVYVDGVYANNPATGEFDWNSIDINSIESIEISEEPGLESSEFAGCIVYITTKTQDYKKNGLSTETAISSYESNFFDSIYQNINYIGNSKDFFYKINAAFAYYENEYFKGSGGAINTFNFAHMGNAGFSWNAKLDENVTIYGSDSFAYNHVKAYATGPTLTTGLEDDYSTQNNFCADFKYDNFETTTILSYFYGQVDYLEQYSVTNPDINVTNTQSVGLRQNMTFKFDNDLPLNMTFAYKEDHSYSSSADRHQLEGGVEKAWNWDWFTLKPSLVLLTYGGTSSTSSSSSSTSSSGASSTSASSASSASSTSASSGATWDASGLHAAGWTFAALPRLTLELADVTVAAYRVFTLPTFNQLYWPSTSYAVGNPDLSAETGWAATVAYSTKDFPLFARFTYTYYENKIRWATIDGVLTPVNTSNADFYVGTVGYEQKVWQSEKSDSYLKIQADFTVTQARLRETYKQIMWVPEYQSHASIFFKYKGLKTGVDYSFTSKRYKTNDNISSYPAMHLLDASISYLINEEFEVYAKGSNLLDQRVVYHDNYYIPSRKWTIGLKFQR